MRITDIQNLHNCTLRQKCAILKTKSCIYHNKESVTMTLQQLRYVTSIAETGTLSEAARRCKACADGKYTGGVGQLF